jgi:hypothetical protein
LALLSWKAQHARKHRIDAAGGDTRDLGIRLQHRPGALAEMAKRSARRAGASRAAAVVVDGKATMHFLFEDGAKARRARSGGIDVLEDRRGRATSRSGTPGQLGRIARLMADADVNIEVGQRSSESAHPRRRSARQRTGLAGVMQQREEGRKDVRAAITPPSPGPATLARARLRIAVISVITIAVDGAPAILGCSDRHFAAIARWNGRAARRIAIDLSAVDQTCALMLGRRDGLRRRAEGVMIERVDAAADSIGSCCARGHDHRDASRARCPCTSGACDVLHRELGQLADRPGQHRGRRAALTRMR